MRERIKKFIATLLALVMVSQLPGFEMVIALAATLSDGMGIVVSADSSEEYVFASGGTNSLTIEENVSITGTITDSGNENANNTIANNGSINQLIVGGKATTAVNNNGVIQSLAVEGSGTIAVTGGEISSMSVASTAGTVTITNCSVGTLNAETSVSFEGNNTASIAMLSGADGSGSLYVTENLNVYGEYVAMDIATLNVDRDTIIYSDKAISVMCEGYSYSISTGVERSILDIYGMVIDTALEDATVEVLTDNTLGKTYLYGDTSDTIVLTTADGYYFEDDYADGITSDGNGTINATLIDDTTLNLTYTFATDDAGEVMINFPAATFIPIAGKGSFSVSDSYYGNDYTYLLSSDTNNTSGVVVQYKVRGADDSTYTTVKPKVAGDYTARVILPGNEQYKELILTDDFSILKASGSATFNISDIYYGGTISPQVASNTNDTKNAVIEYKIAGATDDAYSLAIPTAVGSYTARVTLSENEGYNEVVVTTSFSIYKTSGSATFNISDIYYGGTISPQVASSTNYIQSAYIEYKVYGADDSTYSTTVPTAVGNYTARVTFTENESYNSVVLTDDFTISYLPAPGTNISVSGTTGTNEYFTSAVTITPPAGYLVSETLDGNYSSSLIINSSRDGGYFYFLNIATGEKTAGVWSDGFLIDAIAPSIDAVAGKTYYAEYVEVAIRDENLSKIKINGEELKDLSEGITTLKLYSDGGMKKYEIVVTDLAGNTETINIIVAADWIKSGVLPSAGSVNLLSGYQYKLGSGVWTVEGDATSYNGNIAFYVQEEGEYTFSKQ